MRHLESQNQKQAGWRTDPKRSGAAGCWGDIGTHAYNLSRFVMGLLPDKVSCVLKTFEAGRGELDDYGTAMIRFQGGALGTRTASQITHGRENDIGIEVDGTKGSLEWRKKTQIRCGFESMANRNASTRAIPTLRTLRKWGWTSCRIPFGPSREKLSGSVRERLHGCL